MKQSCIAVLDLGKTLSKVSFWSREGELLSRQVRPNKRLISDAGYACLDAKGIEDWLAGALRMESRHSDIAAIVPVTHGAAAAIVDERGLLADPIDYEENPPDDIRRAYLAQCDDFKVTGAPELPECLNLGLQLFWLDRLLPEKVSQGTILPWPQYWSWRLTGVASSEVSSLGCHTGLWAPMAGTFSPMAKANGWAKRFGPLRRAGDVLGTVSPEWQTRCGLSRGCVVLCGLHDSNAALHAIRGYERVRDTSCTVLSTGTWFIAMSTSPKPQSVSAQKLSEGRDCLINVDVHGVPVPSARFMGGRETDILEDTGNDRIDIEKESKHLLDVVADVVRDGSMALPAFVSDVGPYPHHIGRWIRRPDNQYARRTAASLYLAMMAHASISLTGNLGGIVVEGRFANDVVFTRALASLSPNQTIYITNAHNSVPYGALRLINPELQPHAPLFDVLPLPVDLSAYARTWYAELEA